MDRKTVLFQRLSYRDHRGVSRGPRSVVNSNLANRASETSKSSSCAELKTIFNIFYRISRILSDILISKTFWKR